MKLQPLADRIIAKNVEAEVKTAAGILLSPSNAEKPQVAEVLAVGKDVAEVKVGDKILYSKADYKAFDEYKLDNEEVLVLKEAAIVAILKG
jgi:chaperonin GroES